MEEELFYGNLTSVLKKEADNLPEELISVYNKYTNDIYIYPDLYETTLEIDKMIFNLKTDFSKNDDYYLIDKNLLDYLEKVSLEKGITKQEHNSLIRRVKKYNPLILKLKEFWNRARPYQYANYVKAPLYPYPAVSANSPAYPSGHTLQARVWARMISILKPKLSEWALGISNEVNISRVQMGVHFPSDIEFSKKIYKHLVDSKFI